MAEFSREIDAALRKLAFHFASRLPQDRRLARRVVAYLTEIVEWESEAVEERGGGPRCRPDRGNPDRSA